MEFLIIYTSTWPHLLYTPTFNGMKNWNQLWKHFKWKTDINIETEWILIRSEMGLVDEKRKGSGRETHDGDCLASCELWPVHRRVPQHSKRTDIIIVANNRLMTIVHFDFMPLNVLQLVLVLAWAARPLSLLYGVPLPTSVIHSRKDLIYGNGKDHWVIE